MDSAEQDIAIPIAWPDQTARGDEAWMGLLKKIGLVKNLNFRIGHAAIILIERASGQLRYYDFGRYITPRGYGRARSAASDPRLALETKAIFDSTGKLLNLEMIFAEMTLKESATHGGGRLLASVCTGVSYIRGTAYAEQLVETGAIRYGALAQGNNSCSRYVAQILTQAMHKKDPRIRAILYPEFIKASPTSNVVNASSLPSIYCYEHGLLETWSMNRNQSLRFQISQLKDNFTVSGSKHLDDDKRIGHMSGPVRNPLIPDHAQWLGGIGEGRWFALEEHQEGFKIFRYDPDGNLEYCVDCIPDQVFGIHLGYEFTYGVDFRKHMIRQGQNMIAFITQTPDIAQKIIEFKKYGTYHP